MERCIHLKCEYIDNQESNNCCLWLNVEHCDKSITKDIGLVENVKKFMGSQQTVIDKSFVYPEICATCNLCGAVPESETDESICGYICDITEDWITRDITSHSCEGWERKEMNHEY